MTSLLLGPLIFFTVLGTEFVRCAQFLGRKLSGILFINYITGAIIFLVTLLVLGVPLNSIEKPLFIQGLPVGLLVFVAFLINLRCYEIAGVGITAAFNQLSLPATLAIISFLFNERMGLIQWIAVCLIPVSALLMYPMSRKKNSINKTAVAFLTFGLILSVLSTLIKKNISLDSNTDANIIFMFILFITACIFSGIYYFFIQKSQLQIIDIFLGIAIGVGNAATQGFFQIALHYLPAATVLLTNFLAPVIVLLLFDKFLWKQSPGYKQVIGVAICAVLVVVTISP